MTLPAAVVESGSGIMAAAAPRMSLSRRIWDLDWSSELPWDIDGVIVEPGTFDDALAFMREHYARIFGDGQGRFFSEEMTEAKRRFGEEMDVLLLREEGKAVGLCTAHPSDWSTWYLRTFALVPEVRERRLCTIFGARLMEVLRRVGVARFEAECSAANVPMLRTFTSLGFVPTSMSNSERWGMTLRFTKYLREDAEEVFHRQFLNVPVVGRGGTNEERRRP